MNLKNIPTKIIPLDKIVFDENNPNKMSEEQILALGKVVDKYGFAADPWINTLKDGKYMVIDGEHRVRLLQERGVEKISCKVFKIKYSEVRILRQVANKLRGKHDIKYDAAEFKAIVDAGNLQELADLLAQDKETFRKLIPDDLDQPDHVDEIGEMETENKCPKCGYAW